MNRFQSCLNFLLIACFLAALNAGCFDASSSSKKKEYPRSKVEYFVAEQGPTMLTRGKIKMETVKESPDGRIEYQADDGKTFRVDMTKQADGTYQFGTPTEVK